MGRQVIAESQALADAWPHLPRLNDKEGAEPTPQQRLR